MQIKKINLSGNSFAGKIFLAFAACVFFSHDLPAQTPATAPVEPKFDLYQFYLPDPAIKIIDIQYDKDCTPVKGKLSDDGKTVFIREYREHSRVYLKILRADGTTEEITKSPCFIDPVIHEL